MRIITPRGRIIKVDKVVPFVERIDTFNGRRNLCTEPAKDMKERPTGLKFDSKDIRPAVLDNTLYIGNLTPDVVFEIQQVLLNSGTYDFSTIDYQKDTYPSDTVIDGGTSLPYYTEVEFASVIGMPFGSGVNFYQGRQEQFDFDSEEEDVNAEE